MDKKLQLTNLCKAKVILEAEIERLQIEVKEDKTDIETEAMQLLQNGLNSQDYDTMEVLQSQGLLDFNNLDIASVFAIDGHDERAKAVLDYLISKLHFFLETYLSNDQYDAIARVSETMLTLARIAKTVE